jgi:hypothetical protein
MTVFDDFLSYTSGVYQHVTGDYYGLHAIEVIGYSDSGQYFIAKNSWGTGWGQGGFFMIAYSETGTTTQFGYLASAFGGTVIFPATSFLLTPATLDFGTLALPSESSKELTLTIVNGSLLTLSGIAISVTGPEFSVQPAVVNGLAPGDAAQVAVTYLPSSGSGSDTEKLNVSWGGVTQSVTLTGKSNVVSSADAPQSGGGGGGGGGGCFIATAAYGDGSAWQVRALKEFRDGYLLTNAAGRRIAAAYYAASPRIAAFICRHPGLKPPFRLLITPIACTAAYPRVFALLILPTAILATIAFLTHFSGMARGRRDFRG